MSVKQHLIGVYAVCSGLSIQILRVNVVFMVNMVVFQTLTIQVGNEKTAKNQHPAVEEASIRYASLSRFILKVFVTRAADSILKFFCFVFLLF